MNDIPELIEENAAAVQSGGYKPLKRYNLSFSPKPHAGVPIWLISMTDLMGITLTFFVLLFTMSEFKKPEATIAPPPTEPVVFSEMNTAMGAGQMAGENDTISINKIDYNQALNLGYLKGVLENLAADAPILKKVRFIDDADNKRLIVTLPQDLLFEKGKADLNGDGQKALSALTGVLKHIPNGIEVVGHADPTVATKGGATNWDISLSRALTVARQMTSEGYSRTLPVMGISSGLFDQMPTTLSEEQREALSRRVDLIINLHDNTLQQRFGIGPQ